MSVAPISSALFRRPASQQEASFSLGDIGVFRRYLDLTGHVRHRSLLTKATAAAITFFTISGAQAAMPAVVIAKGNLVSPSAALTYYGTPASPTPPTTRDPLVREAARSLRYNIDKIFAYVRDNVEFVPMFGLQKGARGVVLDGYGTAFDQAQFMVDTLRESDAVAGTAYNPSYKLGQITLTAAQFASWFGTNDAATATKLLANGGIPATVTGTGSSFTVTMEHIWVQATVSGTAYLFDPSFKSHTLAAATDVVSGSGYSAAALLSAAGGASATSISGFNATAYRNALNGYRTNIETSLGNSFAGARADAVIGSATIDAHPASENRRTSLPYATTTDRAWSGQIPTIFRSSFTVALSGVSYGTYYADEVGEMLIRFNYSLNSGSTGFVGSGVTLNAVTGSTIDDCGTYLGTRPAVTPAVATIAINHPYADASGTYLDRTLTKPLVSQSCSLGSFYVSNDWGMIGSGLSTRLRAAALQIRQSLGSANLLIVAPSIAAISRQYSELLRLDARQQGDFFQLHDLIGLHTIDGVNFKLDATAAPIYYDPSALLAMDFEGAVSATTPTGTASADTAAAYVAGLGLSLVEGASPRQENDAVYDMAAIHLLTEQDTRAPTPGTYTTYLATPATWPTIKTNLSTDYPAAGISSIQAYVDEGYSVLVPQHGALRRPRITVPLANSGTTRTGILYEGYGTNGDGGEYLRSAFLAWRPNVANQSIPDRIALVVWDPRHGRVIKAGLGIPIDSFSGAIRKPDQPAPATSKSIRSGVAVTGALGSFEFTPPADLTDGTGDFPSSLSLQRKFDQNEAGNHGLGVGWKSNWTQLTTPSNDGEGALGTGGAQQLASALLSIQALHDLTPTQDAQSLYGAAQLLSWMGDQTINNVAVVTRGLDADETFYRQANGTYVSATGNGAKLVQTGSPGIAIIDRRRYDGISFAYTDHDGTVRNYLTQSVPGSTFDASSPSLASGLTVKQANLLNWTFPNGIKITTLFNNASSSPDIVLLEKASNSLGAAIQFVSDDVGALFDKPTCPAPNQPPVYIPAHDATTVYQNSAGTTVTYDRSAESSWVITPSGQENPICDKNGQIALTRTDYASNLKYFVDPLGNHWAYSQAGVSGLFSSSGSLGGIFTPSDTATPQLSIVYGVDSGVRTVTDQNAHSYNYYFNPFRRETVTATQAANGGVGTAISFDSFGNQAQAVDPLGRATTYQYDLRNQLTKTTYPELNSVSQAYDARSNVTLITWSAKPGSGLADITKTTNYVEAATVKICVQPKICNRPASEIDARTNETDYTWNSTHGQLLTETRPADAAGTRPVTTLGYTAYTGADGATFYLQTSKIEKVTSSSNRKTTYGYDATNKYALKELVVDSTGLALRSCFKFDANGNLISKTDPNAALATCL